MGKNVSKNRRGFHRWLPAFPVSQDSHLKYRAAHFGESDEVSVLNIPDKQGRLRTAPARKAGWQSFIRTVVNRRGKHTSKSRNRLSLPTEMWPPTPCKVVLSPYSLVFPTMGYISYCLWDVVHHSIRHNLIFCSESASFFLWYVLQHVLNWVTVHPLME